MVEVNSHSKGTQAVLGGLQYGTFDWHLRPLYELLEAK